MTDITQKDLAKKVMTDPSNDSTNSMKSTPDSETSHSAPAETPARRRFFGQLSGLTAAVVAGIPLLRSEPAKARGLSGATEQQRAVKALKIRFDAARLEFNFPRPEHPNNGDQQRFSNQIGSMTKTFPHNALGEVNLAAYAVYLRAIETRNPSDFESIPSGGPGKLANPQAAYAFEILGPDSHALGMPAAPSVASAETAGEMVEVYWRALTRDIPFTEYNSHPMIHAAARDLSHLSVFKGPKVSGVVTPGTIFRGSTPGDLTGPFVSQFMYLNVPYGSAPFQQRIQTGAPGVDYMTQYYEWLAIQNGARPSAPNSLDPTLRYIRNGRDLAAYVHFDFTYQAFLNACLILLGFSSAFDRANPYNGYARQSSFATFGGPEILDIVASVGNRALKAAWYQKWLVHRRVRPEAFGGLVQNHAAGAAVYPLHADVFSSSVLPEVKTRYGSYLLPMAYPEGCPVHPAYPAGHSTIAGACSTVLKAFFDEDFIIPNPVEASVDGLRLEPYFGPALTIGGELNKLAATFSYARDTAGVHWRTDGIEGLRLGEELAIRTLKELRDTYNEPFGGYSLTKFDGTRIVI